MLTQTRMAPWQRTRSRSLREADNCPVGQYFDDDENRCVSMCPTGTIYDPDTLLCVPPPAAAAPTEKDQPIYKKPWFIGGVGGAILLGIGIGIIVAK